MQVEIEFCDRAEAPEGRQVNRKYALNDSILINSMFSLCHNSKCTLSLFSCFPSDLVNYFLGNGSISSYSLSPVSGSHVMGAREQLNNCIPEELGRT